ncbi:DUF1294 domain-containing protein [Thalassotalea sp. PS06]|uniref:DUF1294 domain-containing protein n=1 Tax=Thalassotalea sp. PS06 TaxID=2594005 RepID=UPI0011637137|nr:cold shock and DUF1294 domain-containing protein [Thalassotalea sp. PS06]QDP02769.1 DUF1294 domain-containing protein [Thalassotalea sp. PS06]
MRSKGKLISWDAGKGFGFIAPTTTVSGKNVFIHKSDFQSANACRKRTPQINDVITYTLSSDNKGRACAIDATFSGEKLIKKQPQQTSKFSIYLALLFLACLFFYSVYAGISLTLVFIYIGLSIFTFLMYGWDKHKAQHGGWRTSESTLHLFALFGGWPGAAIAQQLIRHKSKKKEFRLVFWMTVILNIFAVCWLLSSGRFVAIGLSH